MAAASGPFALGREHGRFRPEQEIALALRTSRSFADSTDSGSRCVTTVPSTPPARPARYPSAVLSSR